MTYDEAVAVLDPAYVAQLLTRPRPKDDLSARRWDAWHANNLERSAAYQAVLDRVLATGCIDCGGAVGETEDACEDCVARGARE